MSMVSTANGLVTLASKAVSRVFHGDVLEVRSEVDRIIHRLDNLDKSVVDQFHVKYYDAQAETWNNTYWMGIPLEKYPSDLFIYQEILHELKPEIIVECGTFMGGSALYFANICDMLNHGRVISVDIQWLPNRPRHDRIHYITGSSVDPKIVQQVKGQILERQKVLVILDSDHRKEHVFKELEAYSQLVTLGSYLILEDTNVNGHPVYPEHGPGPWEALHEWLPKHPEFVPDLKREKFMVTANPSGYLRKVA